MVMTRLELQQRKDGSWDWEVSRHSGTTMANMGSRGAWDMRDEKNRKTLCYEPMPLYEALKEGMNYVDAEGEFRLVVQTNQLERKEYE